MYEKYPKYVFSLVGISHSMLLVPALFSSDFFAAESVNRARAS